MEAVVRVDRRLMTTLVTYPSKVVTWDDVLSRLRSGEYTQTQGAMCRALETEILPGGDEVHGDWAYCPLGLIALAAGADFEIHGTDEVACDDDGETGLPPQEVLEYLGLTQEVTEEDYAKIPEYAAALKNNPFYEGVVERYTAIIFMSDYMGLRFEKIADEIERLGWNNA